MHRYEPKGPNTETYYKKRKNQQCFFTIKLRLKNHGETIDHTTESWKKDDIWMADFVKGTERSISMWVEWNSN